MPRLIARPAASSARKELEKAPKILSCINLKGGVGKTTIAVNFAAYCGDRGIKTLLVDLDPQANASFSCIGVEAWEKHAATKGTIADLLGARSHTSAEGRTKSPAEVIYKGVFKNVDLIASHVDLFTIDLDLAGATARERRLSRALKSMEKQYGLIVCDCPPNLTLPTQNALAVSTHFVVPVSLDFLSALGIGLLLSRIGDLSADLENRIENAGIIISRVGRPAQHRETTEASIRSQFKDLVLKQVIKDRAVVSEAAQNHQSIFQSNNQQAIAEFTGVYDELAKRIGIAK